jgi:hypothetical protein
VPFRPVRRNPGRWRPVVRCVRRRLLSIQLIEWILLILSILLIL